MEIIGTAALTLYVTGEFAGLELVALCLGIRSAVLREVDLRMQEHFLEQGE